MEWEEWIEQFEAALVRLHIELQLLPYIMERIERLFYFNYFMHGLTPAESAEMFRERAYKFFD